MPYNIHKYLFFFFKIYLAYYFFYPLHLKQLFQENYI